MTSRRSLYEEVWECRFTRRTTLEEDLAALQSLSPGMLEDLRSLFQEAVTYSFTYLLESSAAHALTRIIGESECSSPPALFAKLDSILGEGAKLIKDTISEEFQYDVHLLLEKVERYSVDRLGIGP